MQAGTRSSETSVHYEGGSHVLPIKGSDAGEILINDHQVIKQLLGRLCEAQETAQRQTVLEQLKAALTIHDSMEEAIFYPALAQFGGKKHEAAKLYKETAAADLLVFELDTMLKEGDVAKFEATAKALQGAVVEHVEDEEKHAIPDLKAHANPQQSAQVGDAMREFRSKLHITVTR